MKGQQRVLLYNVSMKYIIILFFGSVQIFFFGIVGEYIGKIYFEVNNFFDSK